MIRVLLLFILLVTSSCSQTSTEGRSDMDALARLLDRVGAQGDINNPDTPRPLVTLEEFFEGNNDYGSIGYNFYPDQPAPSDFFEVFKSIESKLVVYDIRVQVNDQIEPEDWPSTDTIWIITSAGVDEIDTWLGDRFRGDDYILGFPDFYNIEDYDVPEGMQALGVWWD